jgi:hypothetical protein
MPQSTSIGRGAAWVLLLYGLAIARILAQTPPQQTDASLSGRVLDGVTGQSIAGVQVMLDATGPVSARGGATRTGRTTTTDAQGAFTFSDMAPGARRIEATKAGYRTGYAGGVSASQGTQTERLDIAASERRTGVIVRMFRSAVIAGKVRLASGSPVVGTTVTVGRMTSACGVDRLAFGAASTTTDDTGAYRFFDLAPADYVIGTTTVRGSTMASGAHTTYYPGVVDPAASRSVSLRGGDERVDVDIVMLNAGFPVSGHVLLADGSSAGGKWPVDLWSSSPNPVVDRPVARTFTEPDGRFQFEKVPAGHYVTRVVQFPPIANGGIRQTASGLLIPSPGSALPPLSDAPTWWGEARVDVTDRAAETTLRLQEGWRIQGRVTFDAAKPPPAASFESMPVLAFRSDGSDIGGFAVSFQSGRVETDGRFTTAELPPGRYLLPMFLSLPSSTAAPTNLSEQAIRVGGRDVLGSAIEINGGDVSDVTVVFTDRGPAIAGMVEGGEDLVIFGSRVYIFATDEHYWADCGSGWPRLRSIPVGTDGRFQDSGLPPGDYFVAAAIGGEDNWARTEFLRSLVPFATRVTLALGDKASVHVKARPRK